MKLYTVKFITLLIISQLSYANTCSKTQSVSKYKSVIQNLLKQNANLDKITQGKKIDHYSLQAIFGHQFEISKTDERIAEFKETLDKKNGIQIENESLDNCLNQLGFTNYQKELRKQSSLLLTKKIEILEQNRKFLDSIRETSLTENTLPDIKDKISKDSTVALKEKSTLEDDLIKGQSQSLNEKSSGKRELIEYKNLLTKIKIELLDKRIEANKNLEEKIKLFEDLSAKLKRLSSKDNLDSHKVLKERFLEIETLWLSLSSENYFGLFRISESLNLPNIPMALDEKKYETNISDISKLRSEIIQLRKEIIKNYTQKKNQELKLLNNLVSSSSAIRESYYNKLGASFFFKSVKQLDFLKKIKNEFISAPYRAVSYFYSKYLYLSEQISLGKEGYVKISGQLFLILLGIISLFAMNILFKKLNDWIDQFFEFLFKRQTRSFLLRKVFSIWNKIKDSSVLIMWMITLYLIQSFKLFTNLNLFIKVAQVYLAAHIIKSVVTIFLGSISRLDSGNFFEFKKKANETSDKFKNIFLFYFFTMVFIEATVGKVYFYSLLNVIVVIYSLYLYFIESSRWEPEFKKYSERMFAGAIVEKFFRVLEYCPKIFRSTLLLIFINLLMIFDTIAGLTENFEISKKISANLFKKQIEKIEAGDGADTKIPTEYKDSFSLKSLSTDDEYVENGQNLEEKISNEVKEWVDEVSEEHTLVVFGDKGVGKTTLLKRISQKLETEQALDVRYAKLPSKTTKKSALREFICQILNEEVTDNFDLYEIDKRQTRKVVIVIDECQNVFLSQTGGFSAYYELINLINLNTENIFWVMSFNKYSWLFLDRAFGRTQFFRNIFELQGWSDSKIKELIMKRHNKTKFKLSYDLLISATRSQDEIDKYASIESKFFKLLWELSRGNPRAALYLWMTALSRKNRTTFNVNIPKEFESAGQEKMPDELLFVIAHVLKHENLTASEIESTTNLQRGYVRNAIKIALERNFFYRDERHRYMVDITTQHSLIRFLKVKNFIYGN